MHCLELDLKKLLSDGVKVISGIGDGEKIVLSQNFSHLLLLCNNFVTAGRLKKGLEVFGKRVEIVSSARESVDENDKNLMPLIESINKYLVGELDGIIFLPFTSMIKFDLNKFKPIKLKIGDIISPTDLTSQLILLGYERTSLVEMSGQFAVRGDILDIFMPSQNNPIRIEFFDDEIEKISVFDFSTMKNIDSLSFTTITRASLPVGENNVFDLDGVKIIDEPKKVKDEIDLLSSSYQTMSFYQKELYESFQNLYAKSDRIFDNYEFTKPDYINHNLASRSYLTDFLALKKDIEDFKNLHQAILLFTREERLKNNLIGFLNENGLSYKDYNDKDSLERGNIYVSTLPMPYSFSFLKEGVVAIGCDNLFRNNTATFSKGKHAVFYLPKLGDYVVHTFHGIGKCIRIERMKISDIEKDYFVIEYKHGDMLYLPSEEANSISAYIGSEESPKLSSLGGAEFARLKDRVKNSIKQMAISLVEIYRERSKIKGFKFIRDEFLEKKFADAFEFSETPDQVKAIADVDSDMESDKVMDRLICGDVGFGKTEVALRAAFKCIYNGKQVAFLCPTTILSEQHYMTAKERLEPFGVKVEVLNRFKTDIQVKDILKKLKGGDIDMIIGTHRMLSNDVSYKDLGLLILDEEQRFGVEHKEKIKDFYRNIDVLTLSATPIPRTLNMSLSGIRDISVIETPPNDRLPIQTYLADESDQLIKDVLSRELARGGQAFVVYNRVETIDEFASFIRNLMPKAKVGVAHGQMNERTLENVIQRLYNGEYDILVSTTLIENGINLPSANTMIVINSDRLGLSQLYQLRGRIGRSDRLSYAYLMYEKDKVLTEDAYKRLEAIKAFSELGSGFKIAMRDLEIRGAGNIFGKEQHGHIAKVGYDMFVKLLDEEVKQIRGEKVKFKSDVKLEVELSAFISESYIDDSEQRMTYYSKISEISSKEDMEEVLTSLKDGYGEVPEEIKNLCLLAFMRNLAGDFAIDKIKVNKNECVLFLKKQEGIIDERLSQNLAKHLCKLSFDSQIKIKFGADGGVHQKIQKVIDLLEDSKT